MSLLIWLLSRLTRVPSVRMGGGRNGDDLDWSFARQRPGTGSTFTITLPAATN